MALTGNGGAECRSSKHRRL